MFLWCTQNLVKVKKENLDKSSQQILYSQEKVLVLILDAENVCVHRRWSLCTPENLLLFCLTIQIPNTKFRIMYNILEEKKATKLNIFVL